MNRREVAALALRLMGIYCIVEGLLYLQFAIVFFFAGDALGQRVPFAWTSSLVPTVFLSLVGLVLLRRADGLARRITGNAAESGTAEPWTSRQVLAVALAVVGAYLAATSLPQLVGQLVTTVNLYREVSAQGPKAPVGQVLVKQASSLLRTALQAGLGIYLFAAARRLSDLWHRIRSLPPALGEKV